MGYKVSKELEDASDEEIRALRQVVDVDSTHVVVDMEAQGFLSVKQFRFETGHVVVDETTTVELTRLIALCDKGHDHGVYYAAPREMSLWEAMFAIGEINPVEAGDIK